MCVEEGPTGAAPDAVLRKVAWRLIPFIMLLYFVAYLDRVNVGFAALTMNADLGFTATVFGTGAGIFFLGYVLFEVPSNMALEKFGARRWIARIMFSWGVVSCAMAFVGGEIGFYIARFMLGAAEAGFFPGMILYLTYWFPASRRARIIGTFFIAVPFSNVIGAPLSAALMGIEGAGLHGWQWMFLLEGAPAIVLAFVVLGYLTDRPADASWLNADEKRVLAAALDADKPPTSAPVARTLKQGLLNPRIWLFGTIYFGITVGIYGLGFWLPQILQGFGNLSRGEIGLTAALPYAVASVVMFFWSRHSDRTRERIWHVAIPAFTAGAGFVAAALLLSTPLLAFVGLTIAASGVFAVVPAFWTMPLSVLGGAAAAGGIALVNSIGNLGGYLGPFIVGYFRDAYQNYTAGLLAMSGFIVMTGLLALAAGRLQARS